MMAARLELPVRTRTDVERAYSEARSLAVALGWGRDDVERVALSTRELATNLLRYATDGVLRLTTDEAGFGLESEDAGPGIPDLTRAMADGYSTGGGLGSGLPAVRRLMDRFAIESSPAGTRIQAWAWPRPR